MKKDVRKMTEKEIAEAAIPKFDNKRNIGIPIIVGIGGDSPGSDLYKKLWYNHMADNKISIFQEAEFNNWINESKEQPLKKNK